MCKYCLPKVDINFEFGYNENIKHLREEVHKMSEIIVAGAGHGGLVAAWKLAQLGHKVTVYERHARENLGYDQKDPVDAAYFDYAGIE